MATLANQHRKPGKALRAQDIYRAPWLGRSGQDREVQARGKNVVSIEEERRRRRRHIEEIGPQAKPVNMSRIRKKREES